MASVLIEDELCRRAKAAAEANGETLEYFVAEALRTAVLSTNTAQKTYRNGLPTYHVVGDWDGIDPAAVRREIEENGP